MNILLECLQYSENTINEIPYQTDVGHKYANKNDEYSQFSEHNFGDDYNNDDNLNNSEDLFINIENYGVDWESQKIRKKRSIVESRKKKAIVRINLLIAEVMIIE